ncbi:MAG: ribosome silencing factor [Sedimenticola sp.]|nr:ribosome silencing factor [Sedimenticola sp.]
MQIDELRDLILDTLDNMKALDIRELDVRDKTSITDLMIIASGTSNRHVSSMAETLVFKAKEAGETPLGVEGLREGEWVLVDLNGIVVHLMQTKVRDFYQLERLWQMETPQGGSRTADNQH